MALDEPATYCLEISCWFFGLGHGCSEQRSIKVVAGPQFEPTHAPFTTVSSEVQENWRIARMLEGRHPGINCKAQHPVDPFSTPCATASSVSSTSSRMRGASPPDMTREPIVSSPPSSSLRSKSGYACQPDLVRPPRTEIETAVPSAPVTMAAMWNRFSKRTDFLVSCGAPINRLVKSGLMRLSFDPLANAMRTTLPCD
jgi:hypothetical protein